MEVGGVVDILLEFEDKFIEGIVVEVIFVEVVVRITAVELFVLLGVDEFEDGPIVVTDSVTFELEDEVVAGLIVVNVALDELVAGLVVVNVALDEFVDREIVDEPFVLLEVEEFVDELVGVVGDIMLEFESEIAVGLVAVVAAKDVLFEVVVGLAVPNIGKMPVLLVKGIDVLLITRFIIVVVGKVEFVGRVVVVELFNIVALFKK